MIRNNWGERYMTREIGGNFGLEQFSGREYYENVTGVNSTRNALLYILKARKVKKIYIPRFLCDSVAELCQGENCPCEEYTIDRNFRPVFSKPLLPGLLAGRQSVRPGNLSETL